MIKIAIYPGSFDPPTLAHFNIYRQAKEIFDEVIVVIANNATKSKPLLDIGKRHQAWRSEFEDVDLEVCGAESSIVDTAYAATATHVIRGIRGPSDVEVEHSLYDFIDRNSDLNVVYFTVPSHLRTCSSTRIRSIVGLAGWQGYVTPDTTNDIINIIKDYGDF
jgi:pantetheine-phosphate adenylyltransferase